MPSFSVISINNGHHAAHTMAVSHVPRDLCEPPVQSAAHRKEGNRMNRNHIMDKILLSLLIIGGLNWGLVGLFEFDLVAWLFGGAQSLLSRMVYILVAISAVWCSTLLFRIGEDTREGIRAIG